MTRVSLLMSGPLCSVRDREATYPNDSPLTPLFDGLEQVGHLYPQAQRDPVEHLDRGRVFAKLDLREITQRYARSARQLSQGQPARLAPFANHRAERLLERVLGHPQEAFAFQAAGHGVLELTDLER